MPALPRYIYSHIATEGTTGIFGCLPEEARSLKDNLRLLERQPLDNFLADAVLRQIQELQTEELVRLAEEAAASTASPHLVPLLLKILETDPAHPLAPYKKRLEERLPAHFHPKKTANAGSLAPWLHWAKTNIFDHAPMDPPAAPLYDGQELENAKEALKAGRGLLQGVRKRAISKPQMPADETDPHEICERAREALAGAGILEGSEMRHEASLSPIALMRQWRLRYDVLQPRGSHSVRGTGATYGRGLSLAKARAGCLMEIVERASAHSSIEIAADGKKGQTIGQKKPLELVRASINGLQDLGLEFFSPLAGAGLPDAPLYWLPAISANAYTVYVPAQSVFLFCNLDEPTFLDGAGSTGLGAGASREQARLAALLEVIERDAQASTPFSRRACFNLTSRDPKIAALLADYRMRGIFPQFQDMTHESGVPVYRCFVTGKDGSIAQASGASLSGPKAILSALTETPWPYSWANPAPYGQPSGRGLENLPWRFLEDLPDFSLPDHAGSLALLEEVLGMLGLAPIYADLDRSDLGFPACRAFIPGYAASADFDRFNPPSPKFVWRALQNSTLNPQ